jgi:hypothetical protein
MKNAVFWNVTPYDPFKNRRFGRNVDSVIREGGLIEVMRSSETSVLTKVARRFIAESILHSHHSENLKSYITFTGWAL